MKFCKDCKYGQGVRCHKFPDPVTGGVNMHDWRSNKNMSREDGFFGRYMMGTCGIGARFFEPLDVQSGVACREEKP